MVESKMRIEITKPMVNDNPIYGNFQCKGVVEEIVTKVKDEREILPPCGVHFKCTINNLQMEGKIDRTYFDNVNELVGWAYVPFTYDSNAYEIAVSFDQSEIIGVMVLCWDNVGEFLDDEEASEEVSVGEDNGMFEHYN